MTYILELPVTFGELDYSEVSELAYGVVSSVDVISLELVPINITKEMIIQEDYGTPSLEIGVDKIKIGVGKIYGKNVTLKSAKPTILASGLGTHDFYWSMTDDAIHKGSRKSIAVGSTSSDQGVCSGILGGGEIYRLRLEGWKLGKHKTNTVYT